MTSSQPEWLFLMRHAKHKRGVLTKDGRAQVKEVAETFREWLKMDITAPVKLTIRSAPTPESEATARLFEDEMKAATNASGVVSVENGEPLFGKDEKEKQKHSAYTDESRVADQAEELEDGAQQTKLGPTLVIANDPLLSGIASRLLAPVLVRRRSIAIARGELICLRRLSQWRPWRWRWSIAAGESEYEAALRDKLKSKMSVATALGGLIVGLITFLVRDVVNRDSNWWQWGAIVSMAAAGVLYFATLFFYDTLQMPTRYWGVAAPRAKLGGRLAVGYQPPARPPSSAACVMQAAMVHVWSTIFRVATVLVALSLILLIVGKVLPGETASSVEPSHAIGALVGGIALALVWVTCQRPLLGTSD